MKKSIALILSLALLSACGQKDQAGSTSQYKVKAEVMDVALSPSAARYNKTDQVKFPPPVVKPDKEEVSKKIIKEGDIHFEASDLNKTRKAIYDQLTKLKGYAGSESESNDSESKQKEYTINARIPAENFDQFLNSVSSNAVKIDTKNISIRDVTTEYIDMTTRLANKKKLEDRYLELLKKGTKIADLLEIENKLTEIRTDIESTQGQLNYMVKQIDYSTLDITFYTKQSVKVTGETFGHKIAAAFGHGWDTVVAVFFWLVGLWPLLLIPVVLYLLIMIGKWRANRRKRKAK